MWLTDSAITAALSDHDHHNIGIDERLVFLLRLFVLREDLGSTYRNSPEKRSNLFVEMKCGDEVTESLLPLITEPVRERNHLMTYD